jgi:hypothetical protein
LAYSSTLKLVAVSFYEISTNFYIPKDTLSVVTAIRISNVTQAKK